MGFVDWAALLMGAGPIVNGIIVIRRRHAEVPESVAGRQAVMPGALWTFMGSLFVAGVVFDVGFAPPTTIRLKLPAAGIADAPRPMRSGLTCCTGINFLSRLDLCTEMWRAQSGIMTLAMVSPVAPIAFINP